MRDGEKGDEMSKQHSTTSTTFGSLPLSTRTCNHVSLAQFLATVALWHHGTITTSTLLCVVFFVLHRCIQTLCVV